MMRSDDDFPSPLLFVAAQQQSTLSGCRAFHAVSANWYSELSRERIELSRGLQVAVVVVVKVHKLSQTVEVHRNFQKKEAETCLFNAF